jgi:hypothetical protein
MPWHILSSHTPPQLAYALPAVVHGNLCRPLRTAEKAEAPRRTAAGVPGQASALLATSALRPGTPSSMSVVGLGAVGSSVGGAYPGPSRTTTAMGLPMTPLTASAARRPTVGERRVGYGRVMEYCYCYRAGAKLLPPCGMQVDT